MARFIDLSIPISTGEGRLGLETRFETPFGFAAHGWQGSCFSMFCHYGTHVDAPAHFIRGGQTIDLVPIEALIGTAAVVELSDHGDGSAITRDTLERRGEHVGRGDILVLRTGWTDRHWGTERFWADGPYLSVDGAEWIVGRGAKAVVYDFSEEYVVREPGFRGEDCAVHHRLLGNGIYNIEYVQNLGAIQAERCRIFALPLPLSGLDGAPARVVALEEGCRELD